MTNPDDSVRVRARRGGRASVYEANGWAQTLSSGVLDGNGVVPNVVPDMNVLVGGSPTAPDVVIATNPAGYKIALDLVSQVPVALTAPASNSRISAIVAYTDDLALSTTQNDVTGSPASCGLIVVNGAASANPVTPTDTEIRAAITEDGATGSQACYAILAEVLVSATTTTITDSLITMNVSGVTSQNMDWTTFASHHDNGTTSTNIGSNWSNISEYTVPESGIYSVDINLFTGNLGTRSHILNGRILINGVSVRQFQDSSSANYAGNHLTTVDGSINVSLSAGDKITLQANISNTTAKLNYNLWVQQV